MKSFPYIPMFIDCILMLEAQYRHLFVSYSIYPSCLFAISHACETPKPSTLRMHQKSSNSTINYSDFFSSFPSLFFRQRHETATAVSVKGQILVVVDFHDFLLGKLEFLLAHGKTSLFFQARFDVGNRFVLGMDLQFNIVLQISNDDRDSIFSFGHFEWVYSIVVMVVVCCVACLCYGRHLV